MPPAVSISRDTLIDILDCGHLVHEKANKEITLA
jgi:hypothetical protein